MAELAGYRSKKLSVSYLVVEGERFAVGVEHELVLGRPRYVCSNNPQSWYSGTKARGSVSRQTAMSDTAASVGATGTEF